MSATRRKYMREGTVVSFSLLDTAGARDEVVAILHRNVYDAARTNITHRLLFIVKRNGNTINPPEPIRVSGKKLTRRGKIVSSIPAPELDTLRDACAATGCTSADHTLVDPLLSDDGTFVVNNDASGTEEVPPAPSAGSLSDSDPETDPDLTPTANMKNAFLKELNEATAEGDEATRKKSRADREENVLLAVGASTFPEKHTNEIDSKT